MEVLDNAGYAVLSGYGHFLDSLLVNLFNVKKTLKPVNKHSKYIELQIIQAEKVAVYSLIDTDSKSFNKILTVFSVICKEIHFLKNEFCEEFLPQLQMYDEEVIDDLPNEEILVAFSKFLPQLLDLLVFVRRCRQVLIHFLNQIQATFNFNWPKDSHNIMYLKFQEIFSYLGDLLVLLIAVDLSLDLHYDNKLGKHLYLLRQHLKISSMNSHEQLMKVINDLNEELFSQKVFQGTMTILFEQKIFLKNWSNFASQFNRYFRRKLAVIEKSKESDISALNSWAKVVASYAFLTKSFGASDKKVNKMIQDLSKRFIVVQLFDSIIWMPALFLAEMADNNGNENYKVAVSRGHCHQKRLELIDSNTSGDVKTYAFLVFKWTLQMEDLMSSDSSFSKVNGDVAHLCIEGLQLAEQIKLCINNVLSTHSNGHPMTKLSVLNICKLIELLKGVQSIFCRHHHEIGKQMNHTIQKKILQILSLIIKVKGDVFKSGFQEKYVDSYSSLLLAEKMLYSSCSQDKILVIQLALTLINHYPLIDLDATENIHRHMTELYELCSMHVRLEKNSEVNLLFLEEQILPIYFKHCLSTHSIAPRIQYLLQSFYAENTKLEYDLERKRLIQTMMKKEFFEEIEVHLRVHAHSHLKEDKSLEKLNTNFQGVLDGTLFRIYNYFTTIKGLVESYIDETFYDLTTVALHDWQSYREMRSLAYHQFKLETIDDNLPSQTVAQGLDVLEIMRNIHIFVSKYLYNLNTQCFVEFRSNNKHLNTIRIHQIANSIWTHGTGIMNTTVNFIYQFLRKKLLLCSQFLYDEHINSRLTKDYRFFTQEKLQKHALYPYERAEKFYKGISRLKMSSDGLSYLDQYRNLISQIGNALGYVRMIRSGGIHHSIATVTFYPVLEYVNLLENPQSGLFSATYESFENNFFNSLHHLNVEIDALKLLVEVFQTVFHSPENEHLRLFVMIIPSLTINFIQYIVTSKEKMSKRNTNSGLFTDDGFAMGLAYLLSVFNLNEEYDSLHWFESVKDKYSHEEKKLLQAIDSLDNAEGKESTVKLSVKRLQIFKQEFELLQYSLNSARVFFSRENENKSTD